MKYFTPELYLRGQATDPATAHDVDRLWDEALDQYERRLEVVRPDLPEHLRAFNDLLLHDSRVESISRRNSELVMVLRKDIPPRDLITVTYKLAGEPFIDKEVFPPEHRAPVMEFMYDELDMSDEGGQRVFTHGILFGNGWEMQIRFHDLHFILAEPIYPVAVPAETACRFPFDPGLTFRRRPDADRPRPVGPAGPEHRPKVRPRRWPLRGAQRGPCQRADRRDPPVRAFAQAAGDARRAAHAPAVGGPDPPGGRVTDRGAPAALRRRPAEQPRGLLRGLQPNGPRPASA